MALGCGRITKPNSIFSPLSHGHLLWIFWACVWEGLPETSVWLFQSLVSADYDGVIFGATIDKVYTMNLLCCMAQQSGKMVCHLRAVFAEFHQPQWREMLSALQEKLLSLPPVQINLNFEYRILVQVPELLFLILPLIA